MFWIDLSVTFAVAVLSGMGIGSGGLMVLYLTLVRNAPQLQSQGFNLLFFLFAAGASMAVHLSRRHIRLLSCALMVLAGLPFAYLGTRLAVFLPEALMRKIFGAFLIIVGLPGVFKLKKAKKGQNI